MFVGSLNFDPRSIFINSEMGLFIESKQIATELASAVFEELPRVAYRVDLDEREKLRWTYDYNGEHELHSKSPRTSWTRRFKVGFYGLLPIEGQL